MDTSVQANKTACKICQNDAMNTIYYAREMMFDLRETFTYLECSQCHCLQLLDPPADMRKYYPPEYYSTFESPEERFRNPIEIRMRALRADYAATGKGLMGRIISTRKPDVRAHGLLRLGVTKDSRIMDVGCGSGHFLYVLRSAGFSHVMGVDPFIDATISYKNGLTIHKQFVHTVGGTWDIIMFHHSFEHIPNPMETLRFVMQLLAPGGACLIRIPTSSSYAWEHYRTNWVQLDAPRHYFLHSMESMSLLAAQAGLAVDEVVYDSAALQFWGSEQYLRDIPLDAPQSYKRDPEHSLFTSEQIVDFQRRAEALNQQRRGDQAAFYLKKP